MVSCVWDYLGLEYVPIPDWPGNLVPGQRAFTQALLWNSQRKDTTMKGWPRLIVFIGVLAVVACGDSPQKDAKVTPKPDSPTTHVANTEKAFQLDSDVGLELQAQARSAATDFIKGKLPTAIVKGEWSQRYKNNVFWVDVDVEVSGKRAVVPLVLRKFFPEAGEPYWRAVLLSTDLRERQRLTHDEEILRQLSEAELELDKDGNQ